MCLRSTSFTTSRRFKLTVHSVDGPDFASTSGRSKIQTIGGGLRDFHCTHTTRHECTESALKCIFASSAVQPRMEKVELRTHQRGGNEPLVSAVLVRRAHCQSYPQATSAGGLRITPTMDSSSSSSGRNGCVITMKSDWQNLHVTQFAWHV